MRIYQCASASFPSKAAALLVYLLGRVAASTNHMPIIEASLARSSDFFSLDAGAVTHPLEYSTLVVEVERGVEFSD